MNTRRLSIASELDGWGFSTALLASSAPIEAGIAARCREVAAAVRGRWRRETLAEDPAVAEMRRLFRTAGTDPTRYRPSSEALLRRLLGGEEMPRIHPLVDLANCLSAELAVPCCVMREGAFAPPLSFRAGREGEAYESLRGPFRLEERPVLVDAEGPCDAPITGNARVKVTAETRRAWLVAYLPTAAVGLAEADAALAGLLIGTGIEWISGGG